MTRRFPARRAAGLAVAGALLAAATSTATAQPSWPPRHDRTAFAARMLEAHNGERSSFGAPPLAWDPVLAAAADDYASELAATGRWGHSAPNQRVGQGENLWMGTRGAFPLEQMIVDWASEKSMFRGGLFPNVSTTGKWEDVGHYVQIVWPATRRVGCGLRSSARADYLVCRYADPGNVMGEMVSASFKVASAR
jgi:hypothetical protein